MKSSVKDIKMLERKAQREQAEARKARRIVAEAHQSITSIRITDR